MQISAVKSVSWRAHLPWFEFDSCFFWPLMTMNISHSEMFQNNRQLSVQMHALVLQSHLTNVSVCWNPPSSIQGFINSGSKTCTYPDSFHLKTLVCKRWSMWEWRLCWESSCWQSSYCWPLFFLLKSFYGISSLI